MVKNLYLLAVATVPVGLGVGGGGRNNKLYLEKCLGHN